MLFFLTNELDDLNEQITPEEFTEPERKHLGTIIDNIMADLKAIRLGQEMTYDDFREEFKELQDLLYLNKKNWSQLFVGKLTEMIAGGVISETVSKDIIQFVQGHMPN